MCLERGTVGSSRSLYVRLSSLPRAVAAAAARPAIASKIPSRACECPSLSPRINSG